MIFAPRAIQKIALGPVQFIVNQPLEWINLSRSICDLHKNTDCTKVTICLLSSLLCELFAELDVEAARAQYTNVTNVFSRLLSLL